MAEFYRSRFGFDFQASNVLIGPGSKELIFQLIYLIEGTLMVPAPSWVSYGPQAALRGKQVKTIATRRTDNYKLSPAELDRACYELGQTQKLLILNNPNNPTGAVYSRAELKELAEICRAYKVLVISDEIYAMINFTGKPQASLSSYYPEGTIVSGGLSKSFAAGGYRLGVMLIPESLQPVMDALRAVASETYSSVSAPIQYAALEAYGNFEALKPFIEKSCSIYKTAGNYLRRRFVEMELNCPEAMGAFYLFPDFDNYREALRGRGILTGERLTRVLLDEIRVALLPGSAFYLPAAHLGVRVASVDFDGERVYSEWPGSEKVSNEEIRSFFPSLAAGCDRLEAYLEAL